MKLRHASYNATPAHFEECSSETKKEIMTKLTQVSRIINNTGAEWYLVGGLGIAMHNNKSITRKHGGIDIEVDITQMPILREGMQKQGYHLGTKMFTMPSTKWGFENDVLVYRECKIDEPFMKLKDIRFVKEYPRNYSGTLDRLVDFIGVKTCIRTPDGAIISYEGKQIPMKKSYEGKIVELDGEEIKLRNIAYHRYLKNLSKQNGDKLAAYDLLFILERIESYK